MKRRQTPGASEFCVCGHTSSMHLPGGGRCAPDGGCYCMSFASWAAWKKFLAENGLRIEFAAGMESSAGDGHE